MSRETTPWEQAAMIAETYVGEREVTRNQSKFIYRLWNETRFGLSYFNDREPWCAAFVSWCLMKAVADDSRLVLPCELSPSVHVLVERFTAAKMGNVRVPRRGDVVTFLPHFSHVGIVAGYSGGDTVHTIEGNTNNMGAREGDGVFRKQRSLDLCTFWPLPVKAVAL